MDEASNTAASNSGEKQKFFAGSVTFAGNDTLVNAGLFFKICECSRGRCRSQPFATKERYGCGSAACRYTSARQIAPRFTKIFGEFAASQRADVCIGPYTPMGECIRFF